MPNAFALRRKRRLGPKPTFEPVEPKGISPKRFWDWLDALTPEQRRSLNFEPKTGPDLVAYAQELWNQQQRQRD
jgi:hypothetical protein